MKLHLRAVARRRSARATGPLPQPLQRPGGDDPLGGHARPLRALGAVVQQGQLSRRVRVGVDREQASEFQRDRDELVRRVLALGRELISTATPCAAQASKTARRRASTAAWCRAIPRQDARSRARAHPRARSRLRARGAASSDRAPCAVWNAPRRRRCRAHRAAQAPGRARRPRGCRPRCRTAE